MEKEYNNKNICALICKALYTVARHLPQSHSRLNIGQEIMRRSLAKNFIPSMGKNVNIEKNARFASDLVIGDNSGIGVNCILGSGVTIGNNVMMGPNCNIYTNGHEHSRTDVPMIEQGMSVEKPVKIDDDVWIGSNVIILPGVHIGTGVVIGAGAVVTKNIADYSIAGGNPAIIIKSRLHPDNDEKN